MIGYLIAFLIFGVLGWTLDTSYRIFLEHETRGNTYLPYFAIVYGIGGTFLLALFKNTTLATPAHLFIGTLSVTLLELFAGVFCLNVLGRRMWNYSQSKYNLFGHIDLLHTIYWFALALMLHRLAPYLPA